MADTVVMSKSAKKRAAKAARDAAYAENNADAKPAPKAAEKEAPKAAQPKKAAAQPAAPAKADAKAQAKPAAKNKAKPESAPLKQQQKEYAPNPDGPPVEWDDGEGGGWETAKSGPKGKEERQQRKKEREAAEARERQAAEDAKQNAMIQSMKSQTKGDAKAQEAIRKAEEAMQKVQAGKISREQAHAAVAEAMSKQPDARVETTQSAGGVTGSFTCDDEKKIGRLIGPGGKNLTMIKEKTGVSTINTDERTFTCVGDKESVEKAIAALKELNDKGFTTLAFDDFSEVTVMAYTNCFPDIIGKQGAIIQEMKKQLKVEVSMPNVPKNSPGQHPIKIAGEKDQAEACKKVIENIINYYHDELTHPGLAHVEMDVPGWAYSFIIGRGGSEMKHIQKNWDVKVYIPRDTSVNQNVVIVGAPNDVARAQKYVQSLIDKDRTTGREKADKADDHWGDDEVDPELQQYMYKRK